MYGYGAYPALENAEDDVLEARGIRASAGLEFIYFTNQERGYALGLVAGLEIDRTGISVGAQHLTVATDDGTNGSDTIQQLTVRMSYALLVGSRGRVRVELGADTFFAPDITLFGPTAGFSGTLWVFGTFALEGSVMASAYPFWQLDGRAGVVIGIGALGLRAGFRAQLLDDQGTVDGVAHRDVFMGPYAGLGFTF
jgi:hypothetical protein